MELISRRSILIGAAGIAPMALPLAPLACGDPGSAPSNVLNIKDFGAIGDGVADDTVAIETAFSAAGAHGLIFLPPGNFRYTGSGLRSKSGMGFVGAASVATTISLGPESYFIDYPTRLPSLLLRDITFVGGKGIVRHTYEGVNVAGYHRVQSCNFKDYTECAIATESADMPYWHITDCVFDAANTTSAIGVALGGGPDQCVIDSCSFIRNRVHVKARKGNNFHITRCDFLQFAADNSNGPRVAVWIVPDIAPVNAGTGLTITSSKFGNENMVNGDLRILYAEERDGESNGSRLPELGSDSANYIQGHLIMQNSFFGIGGGSAPIVYSTTSNVRGLQISNNVLAGGQPSYVIEFRTPPRNPDRFASTSVFGPFTGQSSTEALPFPASNGYGFGFWLDPQGLQQRSDSVRNWESGASASFREILSEGISRFTPVAATATPVQDAYGGDDAVRLLMNGQSALLYCHLSGAFITGMPTWIELDVADAETAAPARQFYAWIGDDQTAFFWRRCIEVPSPGSGWATYAYCFIPRTSTPGVTKVAFAATGSSETGKEVRIGRPRVYQANERQLGGKRPRVMDAASNGTETTQLVNDLRSKLIALGLVSGTPSS